MESLVTDIRYSLKSLSRRPAFAAIAIVILALGIGATTAIFSVVNGVLLRPLPYNDPDQLVAIRESNPAKEPDAQIAPGNLVEWQRQNTVFSALAAYRTVSYNLTGEGIPERLLAGRVSAGLFALLGTQPILGRDFLAEEDQPGREKVVLIGEGLWKRRFGTDANVVGKTIKLNGENFIVVGVMPASFRLPDQRERELWTPIAFSPTERQLRNAHYIESIGRLKRGSSLAQAQAELSSIAARLASQYPDTNAGWTMRVMPLLDFVIGDQRTVMWLLVGAVGFVLLIVCGNVANLLLARAVSRQKEIAIRAALGAGRRRIVRQLITESVLLACIGGLMAWPLAAWGIDVLLALAPPDLPRIATVTLDVRALLFTIGITLLSGLMFGLAPVWQLSKADLNSSLADVGREGSRSKAQHRAATALIAGEVALATVLMIMGALLLGSLWRLRLVDPGFDYHNSLAVTIQLPEKKYNDPARIVQFNELLMQKIRTLPGVQAVGTARILPIIHNLPTAFYIEGRPRGKDNELPQTNYSAVSPDYFRAMGIPLLRGRSFTNRDVVETPRVAIISQLMAQRYFPGEDPIGKRLNVQTGPEAFREIVGVVGDVKQNGLRSESRPHTYEPFAQAPDAFMSVIVRADSDAAALVRAIRAEVFAIDSEQPVQSVRTLESLISSSIRQPRFIATLLCAFAAAALALAVAGLYGVISYSVAQRTREIGIRVALGAQRRDVAWMVAVQGMKLASVGVAVGIGTALILTRFVSNVLFGVTATDPFTYFVIAGLVTVVSALASYVPARRATRVDPIIALRYE